MLFSGCDVTVAHMNLQQLWLPVTRSVKIKPVKNSKIERGGVSEAPTRAQALWTVDSCWGSESPFSLWKMTTNRCPMG